MKRLIQMASLVLATLPAMAQQPVFTEDFEGAQPAFLLNTTDMSGVTAGDNTWLVNNAYTGGEGTLNCLGIPFSFTIPNTAAQPAGISSAGGKYMHITSSAAINSGILNSNFAAADGLCTAPASHFASMASDVSTIGAAEVNFSFWWLCGGGPNSYGELYYSIDGGVYWTLVSTPTVAYRNQPTWTQQTVSLPQFASQPILRFGFRFVNNTATAANDPAFGIDDVSITLVPAELTIAVTGLSATTTCPGSDLSVVYLTTGTWNTGNEFRAELSDSTGSFANPVMISPSPSVISGSGMVQCLIPASTALGSGFLVRVVGSDPATISGNSLALTLIEASFAGGDNHVSFCSNAGPQVLFDQLPGADSCGTWTGPGFVEMTGILDPDSAAAFGLYTYTTNCPENCIQDQATLFVHILQAPDAGDSTDVTLCANGAPVPLITLLGGTPDLGGSWTGPAGPMGGVYIPGTTEPGCYTYAVEGTAPCPADYAMICVAEDPCLGVAEMNKAWPGLRWIGQQGAVQMIACGNHRPDHVELFDAMGRRMEAVPHAEGDELLIDMSGAAPGMYVVRLHAGAIVGTLRLAHGL